MPRLSPALLALAVLVLALAGAPRPAAQDGGPVPRFVDRPAVPEASAPPAGARLALRLPTSNDGLLRGDYAGFYQDLERTIPGMRQYAWEGGRYGFVRTEARTPAGLVFTRLHQGVDIRPLYRDRNGVPLDTVRAIDDGTVVYVNNAPNNSSYGRYVVMEHDWDGTPVYSLMAHLASVSVRAGEWLEAGEAVGRLGYTGRGINRQRAHVHLEIGLLLNASFQHWHGATFRGANHHGIFNGLNLRGVDVAGLYVAVRDEPDLTFSEFVRRQPVAFRIALPGRLPLELLERYPWLAANGKTLDGWGHGAWIVSFTREGVPIEIDHRDAPVDEPELLWVAPEIRRGHLATAGWLERRGSTYEIGRTGRNYLSLMQTSPAGLPDWR